MNTMAQYNTPEEIAKLSDPDPEFAEVLYLHEIILRIFTRNLPGTDNPQLMASTPQPKIELTLPLVQAIRQQTLAIEENRTAKAIASGRNEEVLKIPMRDGFESEIRIHRPKKTSPEEKGDGSPLIVLFHGGGFFMGM
jgi:acetyl esterase/lipase